MRRLLSAVQSHLQVTKAEAIVVAASAAIVVTGSIGTRLLPLTASSSLHAHTSVDSVMSIIDSLASSESAALPQVTEPYGRGIDSVAASGSVSQHSKSASVSATRIIAINRASAKELEQLPGIGPAMARRIIERRSVRPFTSAEDLLDVKGIGAKTLEKLRPFISVP